MKRSTELKRTGFKRKTGTTICKTAALGPSTFDVDRYEVEREQRLAERAARASSEVVARPATMASCSAHADPVEKDNPLRSEPYRRLVAMGPCKNCRIEGYSQHAHENEGKGKGIKVDDRRGMALCCNRPGIEGCHVKFDQYRLLPGGREAHHAQGRIWAAQTRQEIKDAGLWPKSVPEWQEGGSDAS